jgi:hypothetical protein
VGELSRGLGKYFKLRYTRVRIGIYRILGFPGFRRKIRKYYDKSSAFSIPATSIIEEPYQSRG